MSDGRALAGLIRSAVNEHTVNAAVSTDETLELANVWRRRVGAELASDVDATTTTIPVDDPVPFADGPTQGVITDGDVSETFDITSVDEDACTLAVVRAAPLAWSAGAEVYVLPESSPTYADTWYCDSTGDAETDGVLEAIPVSAAMAARLVLGVRERGAGERVIARKLNASGAAHDWIIEAFADGVQRPLIAPVLRDEFDENDLLASYRAATATINDAIAKADAAATHVFSAEGANLDGDGHPALPYVTGDTWHAGDVVHICTTGSAGAFSDADWINFSFFAQYIMVGVLLTSPLITGGMMQTSIDGPRVRIRDTGSYGVVEFLLNDDVMGTLRYYSGLGFNPRLTAMGNWAFPDGLKFGAGEIPAGALNSDGSASFHSVGVNGNLTVIGNLTAVQSWIDVTTFYNAWVAYGAPGDIPGYSLFAGRVWLRGWLKLGADGVRAFNLPVGYRPLKEKTLTTTNVSTVNTTAKVSTAGDVIPGGAYNSRVSLDGLSFSCT